MAEMNSHVGNFREFQDYWFDLQEKIDAYGSPVEGQKLDSDNFDNYEIIGHSMAHLGDPGWSIYEDIDEHGEAEVAHFLVENAIERGCPEQAGVYWEMFQEADEALRNPEDEILSELDDKGMSQEGLDHIMDQYEEHVEPLLDGSMFEDK